MRTILVVANETLGGPKLLQRAREESAKGDTRIVLCVPRKNPTHGNVIYIDSAYDAAQVRIDLARAVLREMGVEAIGEVGDPDPYTATMDAIAEHHPDQVIVSTLPAAASGWLRRDFVERITEAAGVPVEHIVTDMDQDQIAFNVTLVVANRTANSEALLPELKALAAGGGKRERLFIFVIPIEGGDGLAARAARAPGPGRRSGARRGPRRRRHDRRPGSLYGDDERARLLPHRRHRDLDAARDALGLAARRPHRARSQGRQQAGHAHRGPDRDPHPRLRG